MAANRIILFALTASLVFGQKDLPPTGSFAPSLIIVSSNGTLSNGNGSLEADSSQPIITSGEIELENMFGFEYGMQAGNVDVDLFVFVAMCSSLIQTIVGTQPSSNTSVIGLLTNIAKLPDYCVPYVMLQNSSCASGDWTHSVCASKPSTAVIRLLLTCFPTLNDLCTVLSNFINNQCLLPSALQFVCDRLFTARCSAPSIPVTCLVWSSPNVLSGVAGNYTRAQVIDLLGQASADPTMTVQLACPLKYNPIIAMFNWSSPLDYLNTPAANIIPALTGDLCHRASTAIITSLLAVNDAGATLMSYVSKIQFTCASANPATMSDLATRGPMVTSLRSDCMMCGKMFLTLLQNYQNQLPANYTQQLGPSLASCMSITQMISLAKPGQCQGLSELANMLTSAQLEKMMAQQCMPSGSISDYTVANLQSMGCLALGMSAANINMINPLVLCNATVQMTGCDVPKAVAQQLSARCTSAVNQLPPSVRVWAVTPQNLHATDVDDIKQGLLSLTGSPADMGRMKQLAIAMLNKVNISSITDSPGILSVLSIDRVVKEARATNQTLASLLGIQNATEGEIPDHITREATNEFLSKTSNASALTSSQLSALGPAVTCLPTSLISTLAVTDRPKTVDQLCQYSTWSGRQIWDIASYVMSAMSDINATNPGAELSNHVSYYTDRCLLGLSPSVLSNMTSAGCATACTKIGSASNLKCYLNVTQRAAFATQCFYCATGLHVIPAGYTISDTTVRTLQQLLPDLDTTDVVPSGATVFSFIAGSTLKSIARTKVLRKIQCLSAVQLQAITSRLCTAVSVNDTASMLGLWAAECNVQANDQAVHNDPASVSFDLDPTTGADGDTERMEDLCCSASQTFADKNASQHFLADVGLKFILAIRSYSTNATSSKRKRRQSSTPPTCASVTDMGQFAVYLSVADINAMDATEFSNCVSVLGDVQGWTSDQLTALYTRVKAVTPVCSATSSQLVAMGTIAYAMTTSDISCLQNFDATASSAYGQLPGWSTSQLSAFAAQYMSAVHVSSGAQLKASDLVCLGYFLCGMSPADVSAIPPAEYKTASVSIGQLHWCNAGVLQSLVSVASQSDAYGPISGWNGAVYSSIGIVLGGMSGQQVSTASYSAIEGFSPAGIASLSISALQSLSPAQFSYFSPQQAAAVGVSAISQLSSTQVAAILQAAGGAGLRDDVTGVTVAGGSTTRSTPAGSVTMTPKTSHATWATVNIFVMLVCVALSFVL